MTEQAHGQHLAETVLRDRKALATGGREASSQFWTAFVAAIPDLSGSLDEAADDAVAGDEQVLHWVCRRTEHARRLVRTVTESLIAAIDHKETRWPPSTVHS
jgi:hypothetical protein